MSAATLAGWAPNVGEVVCPDCGCRFEDEQGEEVCCPRCDFEFVSADDSLLTFGDWSDWD